MVFNEFREKWFADFFAVFSLEYNEITRPERSILFEQLKHQKSKIPEMVKKDSLRIVELGAGSGPNLMYFPQNCHLTVVDTNRFFEKHFMEALQQHPGITLDRYVTASAEDMREDIKDESVDAVVVTSVGCSVEDVQQYYKEIHRILVPGGKFYYMEHILGPRGSMIYYIQKLLTATKYWPFVYCNCHLDRALNTEITKADFSRIDQRLFRMPTPRWIMHLIAWHVTGIATK